MLDEVVFTGRAARNTLAAAVLAAIGVDRQPLDVAVVADGDGVVFLGDQVLELELAGAGVEDFGAALVAKLVAQLGEVGADGVENVLLAGEQVLVADDFL